MFNARLNLFSNALNVRNRMSIKIFLMQRLMINLLNNIDDDWRLYWNIQKLIDLCQYGL